ncbi:MAG: hypothetical protein ACPLKQ_07050 [Candidatus Bathyarchaeales archaeon]
MWPYLVGFDPLGYYIPYVFTWLRNGVNFWCLMREAPLFYLLIMPAAFMGTTPLIITLKILPPILHGLLAITIYFYANKALAWPLRKSLAVALLATLYFVALRISWDLLRNELGLIFLFTSLILLNKLNNGKKHYALASLVMAAVALTHLLVATIMLAIVATMFVQKWLTKKRKEAFKLLILPIPATLFLLITLYAGYIMPPNPPEFNVLNPGEEWLTLFGFSSYVDMATKMLGFLVYCYLPIIPVALMSAKSLKSLQVKTWITFSLVATFSPLFPTLAYRWILMLIYPISFYVIETLWNIKSNRRRSTVSAILVILLTTLTIGFLVMPSEKPFPYYTVQQFQSYMPSSMLQNTVPLSECPNVVNCLNWLENNMPKNSVMLAHIAFYGWTIITTNLTEVIPYGYGNPETTAKNAYQQGYTHIYLVWWAEGKGWHGQFTVSSSFKEVYRSGNIAAYLYEK